MKLLTLREADGNDGVHDDKPQEVLGQHSVYHNHKRSNKLESSVIIKKIITFKKKKGGGLDKGMN